MEVYCTLKMNNRSWIIKKKTFYVFAGWLGYSNQLVFLLGRTENLLGRIQKIKKADSLAHVLEINHSQEL